MTVSIPLIISGLWLALTAGAPITPSPASSAEAQVIADSAAFFPDTTGNRWDACHDCARPPHAGGGSGRRRAIQLGRTLGRWPDRSPRTLPSRGRSDARREIGVADALWLSSAIVARIPRIPVIRGGIIKDQGMGRQARARRRCSRMPEHLPLLRILCYRDRDMQSSAHPS